MDGGWVGWGTTALVLLRAGHSEAFEWRLSIRFWQGGLSDYGHLWRLSISLLLDVYLASLFCGEG